MHRGLALPTLVALGATIAIAAAASAVDDTADRGDLDINFQGEVGGSGQSRTVIDGDGADRVFDMRVDQDRIAHLTVRNGQATDGPGGGIRDTAFFNQFQYLLVTDNT